MHRIDRRIVREILHDYKKECFRLQHSERRAEVEVETQRIVDEILSQKFHYHFRRPVDARRAEVIDQIERYTREAVLPPVLGKLVERIVLLERRQEAAVKALSRLGDLLEEADAATPAEPA